GFDVFSVPYSETKQPGSSFDPSTSSGLSRAQSRVDGFRTSGDRPPEPARDELVEPRAYPYSPWSTLRPTSWSPIFGGDADQFRLGASAFGYDVLHYHGYSVSASWLVSGPAGTPRPTAASPDWRAFYTYDRWRPRLYLSAETSTSFFAGPADA